MRAKFRHLLGSVALIAGTFGLPLAAGAPAFAAACPHGTGVTVVVERDGVTQVGCDRDGGRGESALDNLRGAGHATTGTNGYGDSVLCSIDGYPMSTVCPRMPPAHAFWGFFHAPGTGSGWEFSDQGVMGQKMKPGQWVGFRFQTGGGSKAPATKPIAAAPSPPSPQPTPSKPSPPTTPKPTAGQPSAAKPSAATEAAPSASASDSLAADSPDSPGRSENSTAGDGDADRGDGTEAAGPVEDVIDFVSGEDSAAWVPVAVTIALVLALGTGAAVAARRRAS